MRKTHKPQFDTTVNGPLIGIFMKEVVRRALVAIRSQRQIFEVTAKIGYSGKLDDMLTSADRAAQEVYVRSIRECFPRWGIIAEEDNLVVRCTDGSDTFFTIDPLDGTKAFVRRQSHGVGTMISLCRGKEFLAAYVGDVNTQEIYGYRPGSPKVHRISEFSANEQLTVTPAQPSKSYILLRNPLEQYDSCIHSYARSFKNILVDGGSIGVWMARLWKGEVGAVIIEPNMMTPWDENPIVAISLRLGFNFYSPNGFDGEWQKLEPIPLRKKERNPCPILVTYKA